jgi:hypothetical protein
MPLPKKLQSVSILLVLGRALQRREDRCPQDPF